MRTILILIIFGISFSSLAQTNNSYYILPKKSFQNTKQPKTPDYSDKQYWAALPFKKDGADKTPKGYKDNQKSANSDVFYIHPSTYRGSSDSLGWNAQIDNWASKHYIDDFHIPLEASVFNGSCKVYAPYYRQVIYDAWLCKDSLEDARLALDLAYADIKSAFQYYLKNYQKGRPFIIASNEQGSYYAVKLIKEFIENKPLKSKFIAAYIVGLPILANTFSDIKPCVKVEDCGCFLSWGAEGKFYDKLDSNSVKLLVCHNPVTWSTANNIEISSIDHLGAIGIHFKIFKACYSTRIERNRLIAEGGPGLSSISLLRAHYNVDWAYIYFYLDIRKNVEDRVKAFK